MSIVRSVLLSAAVLGGCAACAEDAKIQVSGTGMSKLLPTALVAGVPLKAKGESVEQALAALAKLAEKVTAKAVELGATKDAAADGVPFVIDPAQNAQMNRRMQVMRSGGRLAKKPAEEKKPEVTVVQQLKFRFPLTAKDANSVLLAAEALKAKAKTELTKLLESGEPKKEEEAAAPENEDPDEEMMNGRGESPRGPQFAYFAPITDEIRSAALKEALKQANDSATITAKVLGKTTEVRSVTVQSDGSDQLFQYDEDNSPYERYQRRMPSLGDGLTGPSPSLVLYARVLVDYSIK